MNSVKLNLLLLEMPYAIIMIRNLLIELDISLLHQITGEEEKVPTIDTTNGSKSREIVMHLNVKEFFVMELFQNNEINLVQVNTYCKSKS